VNGDQTLTVIRDRLVEVRDSLGEMHPGIPASEIIARARRHRTRRLLVTAGATGVIAVACAGAVAAAELAGPASPAGTGTNHAGKVFTTAMVRQVARASRIALAHSGHAVISYRDTLGGRLNSSGTEDITFSGQNWNLILHFPPGQEGAEPFVINRVVNGQAYDYFIANHGLRWYHVTGPDAVSSLKIPDPRQLLHELAPAGRFMLVGHTVVGGVRLEQLRARDPRQLPVLNLPGVWPGGHLTALTVWVDGHGVVQKMNMTASQAIVVTSLGGVNPRKLPKNTKVIRLKAGRHGVPAIQEQIKTIHGHKERVITMWLAIGSKLAGQVETSTLTVAFQDIGQPQVITAPAHAINVYGRG
jgi:hypothetical protein